jgi:hypothetical protein
MRRK